MAHIILLGDSVFDHGSYVPGGPDVVKQLRPILPPTGQRAWDSNGGEMTG